MGLGGFFKGLGKGLLKYVAPVAAGFIPGVGPLASMAIQGGLGAANATVSGGGLKDALLGAGLGAVGAKLSGLGKGLSPSKGLVGGLKQVGMNTLRNPSAMLGIAGDVVGGMRMPPGETPPGMRGPERGMGGNKKRQPAIGGSARPRMDMSNPNLAHSILQGRNEFFKSRGLPPAIPTDY